VFHGARLRDPADDASGTGPGGRLGSSDKLWYNSWWWAAIGLEPGEQVMTQTAGGLKSQLALLPRPDRAELAHFLIHSLEEGSDADAASTWESELDQRMQEITRGTADGEPAEKVLAELREKYSCRDLC
jgi:hypothetical protein